MPDALDYPQLFLDLPDGVVIATTGRVVIAANEAAATLFARTIEDLVGHTLDELSAEGAGEDPIWREYVAAGAGTGEWRIRRPDGSVLTVEYHARAGSSPGQSI